MSRIQKIAGLTILLAASIIIGALNLPPQPWPTLVTVGIALAALYGLDSTLPRIEE